MLDTHSQAMLMCPDAPRHGLTGKDARMCSAVLNRPDIPLPPPF
jgi:hypothetical protein